MNGKRKPPIIATSAYLLLLIIVFIVLALAPNGDGTGFIWLVILVFPAGWTVIFLLPGGFSLILGAGLNAAFIYTVLGGFRAIPKT